MSIEEAKQEIVKAEDRYVNAKADCEDVTYMGAPSSEEIENAQYWETQALHELNEIIGTVKMMEGVAG